MAQSSRNTTTRKKTNSSSKSSNVRSRSTSTSSQRQPDPMSEELMNEIVLIGVIAVSLFLFLCNFKILGSLGLAVSNVMFGVFGFPNYIMPIVFGLLIIFGTVNSGDSIAARKIIASIILYIMIATACELIFNMPNKDLPLSVSELYSFASSTHKGGGVIGGAAAYISVKYLDAVGSILLIAVISIICIIIISNRSFFDAVKTGSSYAYERGHEGAIRHHEKKERQRQLAEERRALRNERIEEKRAQKEALEDEKLIREVSGVTTYNFVPEEDNTISKDRDDMHEINLTDFEDDTESIQSDIKIHGVEHPVDEIEPAHGKINISGVVAKDDEDAPMPVRKEKTAEPDISSVSNEIKTKSTKQSCSKRPYRIPPLSLLTKGAADKAGSINELKATAAKLEEVLNSFQVNVTVTDISRGPSVTRYEMIPETGVKVAKIVSLADDIKLNLAAEDIRIEAPIPGKAAIGIEVPNKESSPVLLRDLLESKEFKESSSKISFAVGKDLSGNAVVTDIAKMPHMLIAGATGSGKSVCINTLIMSILYKADPEEVKLILIDPKVVELSVYNNIPHLLIPVVTDPKKASASLAWAVAEMTGRYKKFSDYGVRNLKGYNEAIKGKTDEDGNELKPMYQLVVIVDELADMMMVAGKEVEESICRLAQLARAAGIHLILATQRPSVDVITGLIKANMPSRIAFSVSSGVDSRTILDMNGAEKLLGKGDMLFYPQGYTKPARVQGAFVSDKEVADVVEYLKNQKLGNIEENEISSKIESMAVSGSGTSASSSTVSDDSEMDEFFADAGRLIVESGKCSIGMLQRKFKIGFNRAARIMDALSECGVVGPEEGTKARAILMTPEEFESFVSTL
ncbi:MAG: DNA translocase FtsK [Lachnospiraceae bacterium]|nr:DNA translocase FtsK [Lachnospiraceae bacterium]